MSLSFVSSAVLSSSDGVSHNEERQIESKEVLALRGKQNAAKPLFDQLRSNQEEEDAKREEFQRGIMRGTLALDEDDCAHLDTVQKQRQEREAMVKADTEQEVALFRAARADRNESQLVIEQDAKQVSDGAGVKEPRNEIPKSTTPVPLVPKILVKRRRRQQPDSKADSRRTVDKKKKQKLEKVEESSSPSDSPEKKEENGLGGLLGGYGSSDDESD